MGATFDTIQKSTLPRTGRHTRIQLPALDYPEGKHNSHYQRDGPLSPDGSLHLPYSEAPLHHVVILVIKEDTANDPGWKMHTAATFSYSAFRISAPHPKAAFAAKCAYKSPVISASTHTESSELLFGKHKKGHDLPLPHRSGPRSNGNKQFNSKSQSEPAPPPAPYPSDTAPHTQKPFQIIHPTPRSLCHIFILSSIMDTIFPLSSMRRIFSQVIIVTFKYSVNSLSNANKRRTPALHSQSQMKPTAYPSVKSYILSPPPGSNLP